MATSRRNFLAGSAGVAFWPSLSERVSRGAGDRIRFGCIGVGGKGESDSDDAGQTGDVIAICDVDEDTLHKAAMRFPNARTYTDYRVMVREMHSGLNAVTVSTPDHNHAPASILAMAAGLHCFCQKPLAHSIYEVRRMASLARRHRLVTQMGNQGTAESGLRKSAALIRAGVLGKVSEVHVWTNRPIWPQGIDRPAPAPVPANLHWDTWIGPAPDRPYAPGYAPFSWRGWWDFGTGALGDMACHTMNMPFMALDLRNPTSVSAASSGTNKDSYPLWSVIDYQFPATDRRPAVKMTWYDGGKKPPIEMLEGRKMEDSGILVVGDAGKLYSAGDYGSDMQLIGGRDVGEVTFPVSPGHFEEFVRGIKHGPTPMSNFPGYAGPLAETVLLGNLAVWAAGTELKWDARRMECTNLPEVNVIVHPEFHHGYSV